MRSEHNGLFLGTASELIPSMHILFVHQNFPAQFGHIASHLAKEHGFRCTFLSERPAANSGGVERIQYQVRGGATERGNGPPPQGGGPGGLQDWSDSAAGGLERSSGSLADLLNAASEVLSRGGGSGWSGGGFGGGGGGSGGGGSGFS